MANRSLLLLLLVSLLGCDRTEDPESFEPDTGFESGVDLADDSRPWTFAMKQVQSVLQTDPSPFGNDQAAATVTALVLVQWERSGTAVTWTETVCAMRSNEVFGTTTSYPDAFVAALGTRTRTGELSGETTGAVFTAGPYVDVIGAALADPWMDALPTGPDDATVRDEDGDGHPGVTVHVRQNLLGEGDVYVAQRIVASLSGTAVGPDRVEGFVEASREQSVLGATAGWLEIPVEEEADPDASHSFFLLQGLPDGSDCAEVVANEAALFE